MELVTVELVGYSSNAAVVRLAGRKYPGIVLQGDSLHAAESAATRALHAIDNGNLEEAKAEVEELRVTLRSLRQTYEDVLAENDLPLPYAK